MGNKGYRYNRSHKVMYRRKTLHMNEVLRARKIAKATIQIQDHNTNNQLRVLKQDNVLETDNHEDKQKNNDAISIAQGENSQTQQYGNQHDVIPPTKRRRLIAKSIENESGNDIEESTRLAMSDLTNLNDYKYPQDEAALAVTRLQGDDNTTLNKENDLIDIEEVERHNLTVVEESEVMKINFNAADIRLIDFNYVLKTLQKISNHDPILNCSISHLNIVGGKSVGLLAKFKLKCSMCNRTFIVATTDDKNDVDLNINLAAVSGIMSAGIGYSQFQEVTASIGLPIFGEKMYADLHDRICDEWENTAVLSMEKAAARERQAALNEGKLINGIPAIDVYLDASWAMRSYGSNFRSNSGTAAIIGRRFGEVLFMAVRNKYCIICKRAENKGQMSSEHKCFKNYDGPSTAMEADIVVEGFKNSIPMYDMIYARMIADGDSSTYAKVLEAQPYGNFVVEKIECRNHILRNMCNKLRKVSNETSTGFTSNLSNELGNSTFWFRLKMIINKVAGHARSLIEDVDTNTVERFNSIIAKYVGGKRINYSLKRSYQGRCAAAVVAHNTRKPLYHVQKSIIGRSPRRLVMRMEEQRIKKRNLTNTYLRKKNRIHQQVKDQDRHYGENCMKPDIPEIEKAKEDFLFNLRQLTTDKKQIERETVLQRDSSQWLELRKYLITASNFGKVAKRNYKRDVGPLVKSMIYAKNLSHVASISHGIENETMALEQLAVQENVVIEKCGLFIDSEHCFIGATPDGIIGQDMIVEIKCPIAASKMEISEAIQRKKIPFWHHHTAQINTHHNWYYQIQGQLHVTGRRSCLFAVWGGENKPLKVEYINKDDEFWSTKIIPKLIFFYYECLLPELVDPRHPRGMPIRNPGQGKPQEEELKKKEQNQKMQTPTHQPTQKPTKCDNGPAPSCSTVSRQLNFSEY